MLPRSSTRTTHPTRTGASRSATPAARVPRDQPADTMSSRRAGSVGRANGWSPSRANATSPTRELGGSDPGASDRGPSLVPKPRFPRPRGVRCGRGHAQCSGCGTSVMASSGQTADAEPALVALLRVARDTPSSSGGPSCGACPAAPNVVKSSGSMRRTSNTSYGQTRTQSRLASQRPWSTTGRVGMAPDYEGSAATETSYDPASGSRQPGEPVRAPAPTRRPM